MQKTDSVTRLIELKTFVELGRRCDWPAAGNNQGGSFDFVVERGTMAKGGPLCS